MLTTEKSRTNIIYPNDTVLSSWPVKQQKASLSLHDDGISSSRPDRQEGQLALCSSQQTVLMNLDQNT